MKKFLVSLAMVLMTASPAFAAGAKVTLCHAAPPDAPKKYVQITVAAAGAYNGHYTQHDGDIIPPFEFKGTEYSKNWPEGQATFDNACVVLAPEATPTPTPGASATPTPAATGSPPAEVPKDGPKPQSPKKPGIVKHKRVTHPRKTAPMPFTGFNAPWAFAGVSLILLGLALVRYSDAFWGHKFSARR